VRGEGGSPDLLWRYLDYLVCQGSSQAALHTELALTLADVALQLLPTPQTSGAVLHKVLHDAYRLVW